MSEKKIPVRMCVACREPHDKRELLRVVRNGSGEACLDITGKAQGRGAYICASLGCLEKAVKSKALSRALECQINDEVYSELKRVILRREIGK